MIIPNGGFPPIKYKNDNKKDIDKKRGFIIDKKEINMRKIFDSKKVKPIISDKEQEDLEEADI